MTTAVAILNQKGGSGKTPVTINLAAALSALGKSVLVFDLDGQGNLPRGSAAQGDRESDGDSGRVAAVAGAAVSFPLSESTELKIQSMCVNIKIRDCSCVLYANDCLAL